MEHVPGFEPWHLGEKRECYFCDVLNWTLSWHLGHFSKCFCPEQLCFKFLGRIFVSVETLFIWVKTQDIVSFSMAKKKFFFFGCSLTLQLLVETQKSNFCHFGTRKHSVPRHLPKKDFLGAAHLRTRLTKYFNKSLCFKTLFISHAID